MQATARTHRPPLIRPIAPYEALKDGGDVHLMPRIPNHPALFRERVQRMPRDEPCCFDLVFVEEFEEATDANGTMMGPTSRDVAGGVFAAIGAQPAGYRVDVDRDAAERT
ncbi:MAG: hypothetical protein Q9194_006602 [Teloschistes cf. exilis]